MEHLKVTDLFVVIPTETVYEQTNTLLTELYQPFLGTQAIGIYQTFRLLYEWQKPVSFHKLLAYTKLEFPEIVKNLEQLCAANLINYFIGKSNDYDVQVFKIQSPLTKDQFLKDPMLVCTLAGFLGPELTKKIESNHLNKVNDFPDILTLTKQEIRFADVFKERLKITNADSSQQVIPSIIADKKYFFDTFLILLSAGVRQHFNFNPAWKQLLADIADLYSLTSEQMALAFSEVYRLSRGAVTEDGLRKSAYKFTMNALRSEEASSKKFSEQAVQKNANVQIVDAKITKNTAAKKALQQMKTVPALEYVKLVSNSITPQDIKNIERLLIDYQLPEEVINVLINYVYNETGNLSWPYMQTIAQNWRKINVVTAENAYIVLRNFMKAREKRSNNKKEYKGVPRREERVSVFEDANFNSDVLDEEFDRALAELEGK